MENSFISLKWVIIRLISNRFQSSHTITLNHNKKNHSKKSRLLSQLDEKPWINIFSNYSQRSNVRRALVHKDPLPFSQSLISSWWTSRTYSLLLFHYAEWNFPKSPVLNKHIDIPGPDSIISSLFPPLMKLYCICACCVEFWKPEQSREQIPRNGILLMKFIRDDKEEEWVNECMQANHKYNDKNKALTEAEKKKKKDDCQARSQFLLFEFSG